MQWLFQKKCFFVCFMATHWILNAVGLFYFNWPQRLPQKESSDGQSLLCVIMALTNYKHSISAYSQKLLFHHEDRLYWFYWFDLKNGLHFLFHTCLAHLGILLSLQWASSYSIGMHHLKCLRTLMSICVLLNKYFLYFKLLKHQRVWFLTPKVGIIRIKCPTQEKITWKFLVDFNNLHFKELGESFFTDGKYKGLFGCWIGWVSFLQGQVTGKTGKANSDF